MAIIFNSKECGITKEEMKQLAELEKEQVAAYERTKEGERSGSFSGRATG